MENLPFCGGDAASLGQARPLSARSFAELVTAHFSLATTLNVTRAEYAGMDKRTRQHAKRVPFVTPASFGSAPSRRLTEHVLGVRLICIDIDDGTLARPLAERPDDVALRLEGLNFVAHKTASSTTKAPRLRIVVEAMGVPAARYLEAVEDVAWRLGLPRVNSESSVLVQPMFLPTLFKGDSPDDHPVIASRTSGRPYGEADIVAKLPEGDDPTEIFTAPLGDELDYLRAPLREVQVSDVEDALRHVDADVDYGEWLAVAAALRHQFPHEPERTQAYELFDRWSSTGTKYVGRDDTEAKWRSLRPSPRGRAPVTVRTLLKRAAEAGWNAGPVKGRVFADLITWLKEERYDDAFLDRGLDRIAGALLLTSSEEEACLGELSRRLRYSPQGLKVGPGVLRRDLRRRKDRAHAEREAQMETPAWCRGLCYVSAHDVFYRQATGEKLSPGALDRVYGNRLVPDGPKDEGDGDSMRKSAVPPVRPQDFLLNVVEIPKVYDLKYDPRYFNDIYIMSEGRAYVNTFVRAHPEPNPAGAIEAGRMLESHLERLVAEPEYRRVLLDYLTYIIQRPGFKIRWTVLLQGAEGCGKTFICRAMEAVLGTPHVFLVEKDTLHGQWTEWAHRSQLVVLEEVRVKGQNRHEVMDKLKPLITNDRVGKTQRFTDAETMENLANYLLFTNHHDALALSANDRRYFVIKSAIQTKAQVRALGENYFLPLFDMLVRNAAGLRAYFEQRQISPDFRPDGPAPSTTYRDQLVVDSASDVATAVREALDDSSHALLRRDLLSASLLMEAIQVRGMDRVSPQHLASVLREEGYIKITRAWLKDDVRHPLWMLREAAFPMHEAIEVANQRIEHSDIL